MVEEDSDLAARVLGKVNAALRTLSEEEKSARGWRRRARRLRLRLDKLISGESATAVRIELDHFHPERVAHQITDGPTLWRCLNRWNVDRSDVLVDFGCGRGRVLLHAARLPLRRVVGIEVSATLAAEARQALEQTRPSHRCHDVEVIEGDAGELDVPDEMTIAYLYSPFVGLTFDRWLAALLRSLERSPRRVRIIYFFPIEEQKLLATGAFRVCRQIRGGAAPYLDRVTIFESVAEGRP